MQVKYAKDEDSLLSKMLRDYGKIPIPSREQEVVLGHQIQKMMRLLEIKENNPTLSSEEWAKASNLSEIELKQALNNGQKAKQTMIAANIKLVISVAKKHKTRGLELEDLIHEGVIGLKRAAEKFDPTKGYKFSTYATWWVRQTINRAIENKAKVIKLPVHAFRQLTILRKASKQLTETLGRKPSVMELSAATKIPIEWIENVRLQKTIVYYDAFVKKGDETDTFITFIESKNDISPEDYCQWKQIREIIANLPEEERLFIKMKFFENSTEKAITAKFGWNNRKLKQVKTSAFKTLKKWLSDEF